MSEYKKVLSALLESDLDRKIQAVYEILIIQLSIIWT